MESKYAQIHAAGLGLAAVSYDSPEVLKAFSERMHIEFPLLSDKGSAVIARYGILNTTVTKGSMTDGIPYPGIYILDANGVVKSKFFEDDFKQRDTAGLILLQQFGMAPPNEHATVAAKHLTLNIAATDSNLRVGQHLALVLDVALPAKVHVYAPGVKGYIPIDWQMPDTAAVKVDPVTYPASTLLRLEAIKETVPVYTDHFQLVRYVTTLQDTQEDVTVTGTFRYQACDDEKCFLPESVPLSVTLHLQKLDRVRATQH